VDRDYEIFECLSDGFVMWRARETGLRNARLKLDALLRQTGQEYFAIHLMTRDVIFATDQSRAGSGRATKRIFQIAYTEALRVSRSELLRSLGYPVVSVVGNEAAMTLLTTLRHDKLDIAVFIVGHAAPADARKEMVEWLKANYPMAKVLALNSPNQQIELADYNVKQNGPDSWLPLVMSNISPLQAS